MKQLFSILLIAAVAVVGAIAEAQQTEKTRVIGILSLSAKPTLRDDVFQRRLRELGWVAGQTVRIEYRRAANKVEHLPALAEELVRLKVDLIVAQSTPAVQAAKNATRTIPMSAYRQTRLEMALLPALPGPEETSRVYP